MVWAPQFHLKQNLQIKLFLESCCKTLCMSGDLNQSKLRCFRPTESNPLTFLRLSLLCFQAVVHRLGAGKVWLAGLNSLAKASASTWGYPGTRGDVKSCSSLRRAKLRRSRSIVPPPLALALHCLGYHQEKGLKHPPSRCPPLLCLPI